MSKFHLLMAAGISAVTVLAPSKPGACQTTAETPETDDREIRPDRARADRAAEALAQPSEILPAPPSFSPIALQDTEDSLPALPSAISLGEGIASAEPDPETSETLESKATPELEPTVERAAISLREGFTDAERPTETVPEIAAETDAKMGETSEASNPIALPNSEPFSTDADAIALREGFAKAISEPTDSEPANSEPADHERSAIAPAVPETEAAEMAPETAASETTAPKTTETATIADLEVPRAGAAALLAGPAAIAQTLPTEIETVDLLERRDLDPNPNPLQFPTRPVEVEIQRVEEITLEEAIDLSIRNNGDLREDRVLLERRQEELREALADWLPDLQLTSAVNRTDSANTEIANLRSADAFTGAILGDTVQVTFNASLQLTYDIYTGGRRGAQIRAARRQIRLQELAIEQQFEQTVLDVTDAYYNLQEADEQVRISQAAVRNARQSLRDTQARERAGLGTRFDVLRSEVQLANDLQSLTQTESVQKLRRRELAQLLSVPQSVNLKAADEVAIAGVWTLSLEESIVLAFKNRAELEQELVQQDILRNQRKIALSVIRPQLQLVASYDFLDILDDEFGSGDGTAIGAQLQWNLFDGGAASAAARQQDKDIEISRIRFASTRNLIRLQVEQSFFDLQANLKNIQTAETAVEQARESLRLARLRFGAGVGTQTDVIQSETDLTEAEGNRLQAIVGYNRALANLQRSISNRRQNSLELLDGGDFGFSE